jgi:hypothetical protein
MKSLNELSFSWINQNEVKSLDTATTAKLMNILNGTFSNYLLFDKAC